MCGASGCICWRGLICAGFAATDEYHQSFVAGRGPSVRGCLHRYVWSHDRHHRNTDCRLGSVKSTKELERERKRKESRKKKAETLIGKKNRVIGNGVNSKTDGRKCQNKIELGVSLYYN